MAQRPENQAEVRMTVRELFLQGTKDGKYYYINSDLTWKDNFFNCWVHSRIEVNYESKQYHIALQTIMNQQN